MRVRRLLSALLTTTLVGSTAAAVATASPAAAGGTTETRIVGGFEGGAWLARTSTTLDQPGPLVFRDALSLDIDVETASGEPMSGGTLTVQRRLAGQSQWTTVASSDTDQLEKDPAFRVVRTATYRVLYSGDGSYAPTSSSVAVKVQRDLNEKAVSSNGLFLQGKVAPRYAKKKVVVQKKVGKQWKRYSVVRTDGKSFYKARIAAPPRRGIRYFYRLVIPAGSGFATTKSFPYYTKRL